MIIVAAALYAAVLLAHWLVVGAPRAAVTSLSVLRSGTTHGPSGQRSDIRAHR